MLIIRDQKYFDHLPDGVHNGHLETKSVVLGKNQTTFY